MVIRFMVISHLSILKPPERVMCGFDCSDYIDYKKLIKTEMIWYKW